MVQEVNEFALGRHLSDALLVERFVTLVFSTIYPGILGLLSAWTGSARRRVDFVDNTRQTFLRNWTLSQALLTVNLLSN